MLFFHLSLHIWMFHNQTLNNRIDKLQERALRLDLKLDSNHPKKIVLFVSLKAL